MVIYSLAGVAGDILQLDGVAAYRVDNLQLDEVAAQMITAN